MPSSESQGKFSTIKEKRRRPSSNWPVAGRNGRVASTSQVRGGILSVVLGRSAKVKDSSGPRATDRVRAR